MSKNWLNLTIRFLLELVVLYIVGRWGFENGGDFSKYFLAVFLPVTMAVCWAVFRYPNDPKKHPVIPVGGRIRLLLEFLYFFFGILALYNIGHPGRGADMIAIVLLHYAFSYDRVLILIKEKPIPDLY